MVNKIYKVLHISTYHHVNFRGVQKVSHDFKTVFVGNSFDAVCSYLLGCDDGFYRVSCRTDKKFLYSLRCKVENHCIFFN